MTKLLTFLLLTILPLKAAVLTDGILAASDTTGTNATVRSVTISGGTNLNAGVLNATNDIRLNGVSIFPTGTAGTVINTGASTIGQIAVYRDTTGTNINPSSGVTNLTLVTPTITVPGGYYAGAILTPWVDTNNAISLQWKKAPQIWEMGGNGVGELTTFAANSGSSLTPTSIDLIENGLYSHTTGSLTNGTAGLRTGIATYQFVTNNMAAMIRIRTPAALSTAVDAYEIYAGFGDANGDAAPADGAYFYYTHTVSNGVWTARTANNSASTYASGAPTTPPTVAIDTWYNLLIEGNASVVNFWVSADDGVTWQWIGYSTANIPNNTVRVTGIQNYIRKVAGSTGTNARVIYTGRWEFWPNRGN